MSLHLEFEPHSWYGGFAIKTPSEVTDRTRCNNCMAVYDENVTECYRCETDEYLMQPFLEGWTAVTDDGNTYRIVEIEADTLKQLKTEITAYRKRKGQL